MFVDSISLMSVQPFGKRYSLQFHHEKKEKIYIQLLDRKTGRVTEKVLKGLQPKYYDYKNLPNEVRSEVDRFLSENGVSLDSNRVSKREELKGDSKIHKLASSAGISRKRKDHPTTSKGGDKHSKVERKTLVTPEDIEIRIQEAIEKDHVQALKKTLPELEGGINARLEYGCAALMIAVDEDALKCAKYLLNLGVRIEDHEREYTPLFTAAEKGHFEMVKLLLKYGANLTGEFHFNKETALSISASKFCHIFQSFLEDEYLLRIIPTDKSTHIWKMDDIEEFEGYWDQLSQLGCLWKAFSENDCLKYARDCASFFKGFLNAVDNRIGPPNKSHFNPRLFLLFKRLTQEMIDRAEIFALIDKKWKVLQEAPPSKVEDGYATDEDGDIQLVQKMTPLPPRSSKFSNLTRAEVKKYVEELNKELKTGKTEADIDWSKYPSFFIFQYRGIHYFRGYFTKNQRKDHRTTHHLNRIAPAGSVYHMCELTPGNHQMARESKVKEKVEVVQETFKKLEKSGPVKGYWRTTNIFGNYSDMVQQRMSNTYNSYMKDLKKPRHPAIQILSGAGIDKGYPHYATSDLPGHSLKYAYGQKKVEGLTEQRLRPVFQKDGKRLHPYPGKVFMTIFTPLEMHQHHTRHVAGMHNRKDIKLKGTVAPERETGFTGGVDPEISFYEELLVIPSFETYQKNYQEKYGISRRDFDSYKKKDSIVKASFGSKKKSEK